MKLQAFLESMGSSCVPEKDLPKRIEFDEKDIVRYRYEGVPYIGLKTLTTIEETMARDVMLFKHRGISLVPNKTLITNTIAEFEAKMSLKVGQEYSLHPVQKEAVFTAVSNPICVITGGPGTGKTTTLKCILYVLDKVYKTYHSKKEITRVFLAPTGKAARRMSETLNTPAYTVQSYLKTNSATLPPLMKFDNEIVVDEVSMLDEDTAYNLFRAYRMAIKSYSHFGCRMIMLGDVDQLPSVGIGAVLRDLIESDVIPVCKLEVAYRQESGSVLSENIKRIQAGKSKLLNGDDFSLRPMKEPHVLATELANLYCDKAKQYGGFDKVFLLTPMKKYGDLCSDKMNELIRGIVNPRGPVFEGFRLNDPVIQLKNRYDCGIVNGSIGTVAEVRKDGLTVRYPDENVNVDYVLKDLGQIALAYAMTVHKSQGSEYPCIISCGVEKTFMKKGSTPLINRNLILTAVSRSKKECVLYMDQEDLDKAIEVEAGYARKTMFKEFLIREDLRISLIERAN